MPEDQTESTPATHTFSAPNLPYKPQYPKAYRPKIGMIACGGITYHHLKAYKAAGYEVVALCDLIEERAEKRRAEFDPDAVVTTDHRKILERDDIEVVDVATHPHDRLPLIEDALNARKHVLSQKPFVLDLDTGERLASLAEANGVRLAVNQNGRWSPHFSYIREAVKAGVIGDLLSVHAGVHWDHSWVKGTSFEPIFDLILYDFSIHWFDFVSTLLADRTPTRVYATRAVALDQPVAAPMLAQSIIEFPGGQCSLVFDGITRYGGRDTTYAMGTKGAVASEYRDGAQRVTVTTDEGSASPQLEGAWFSDGFHGTMGELLRAIEEGREPTNSARNNLQSLALCYAAIASANEGVPKQPGEVRSLPKGSAPGI